jgi:hypothetical protein
LRALLAHRKTPMLGIDFLNEYDRELFRDEVQRPWIIRLTAVDVLSRLHPNCALRATRERSSSSMRVLRKAALDLGWCRVRYHKSNSAK